MRNDTRAVYRGYLSQIASLCAIAVDDVSKKS